MDADIDEAQGLEHLFEVMRNAVEGTHQPLRRPRDPDRGSADRPGLSLSVHVASGSPPQRVFHPRRRGFDQARQLRFEFLHRHFMSQAISR